LPSGFVKRFLVLSWILGSLLAGKASW